MNLFKTKTTRGVKLGKILTQLATFIVAETYVGETEAQHQLSQAMLAIEKAQKLCVGTDDERLEGQS